MSPATNYMHLFPTSNLSVRMLNFKTTENVSKQPILSKARFYIRVTESISYGLKQLISLTKTFLATNKTSHNFDQVMRL